MPNKNLRPYEKNEIFDDEFNDELEPFESLDEDDDEDDDEDEEKELDFNEYDYDSEFMIDPDKEE